MSPIDFKAVKEARAALDKLCDEHPELIDRTATEDELVDEWLQTMENIEHGEASLQPE
jgi:hypothetical protein